MQLLVVRNFLCLALSLLLFASCSRKLDTEASISLDLEEFNKVQQGVGSSAVPTGFHPEMILINVHYDGNTFLYDWQCPYADSNSSGSLSDCQIPSLINLGGATFPNGSNRIVQVLLVYTNEAEEFQFYYADKTLDFEGGTLDVSIGDNGWEANSSTGEGKVGGLLHENGDALSTLSGRVEGFYQPGNGAHRMKVINDKIFAGWFDFMFLEGVQFTYKMKSTGKVLFSDKSLNDFVALATASTANQAAYIEVPSFHEVHWHEDRIYLSDMSSVSLTESSWQGYENSTSSWYDIKANNNTLDGLKPYIFNNDNDTVLKQNSAGSLPTIDFTFNDPYNFSSLELWYKVPGTVGTDQITFDITDGTNSLFSNTALDATGSGYSRIYKEFDAGPFNAANGLIVPTPVGSGLEIADIKLYRKKYHSYLVNSSKHIYGFYDLATQDFLALNALGAGIGWPASTNIANAYVPAALGGTDPIINAVGSFTNLASMMTVMWNKTSGSTADIRFGTGGAPSTNADCATQTGNVITTSCFDIQVHNVGDRSLLPIEGPYVKTGEIFGLTCTLGGSPNTCTATFNYIPGAAISFGTVFFKMSRDYTYNYDFADCRKIESDSLAELVDVVPGTTGPSASFSEPVLLDYQVLACPYTEDGSGNRIYHGFAREVHW